MTAPTLTRRRVRACANLALIAERRRARALGREVRRRRIIRGLVLLAAELQRREARRRAYLWDAVPLFDIDHVAVHELAADALSFQDHTGPLAPTYAEQNALGHVALRRLRRDRSRERATYDGERWLAIQVLHMDGLSDALIAERLHTTDRAVLRWRQKPAVGWPTGEDARSLRLRATRAPEQTRPRLSKATPRSARAA